VDEYLAGLEPDQRAALAHVREVVHAAVPDAEEGVSYGMPAFRWRGKPLLGLRAAKAHLSLFPFSPAAVDAVADRLAGFDLAKGTIRFTPDHPVPDEVIVAVVTARQAEIAD
jgi:uncharacterized protein YdhG (YjbR/CyaY superfamily)